MTSQLHSQLRLVATAVIAFSLAAIAAGQYDLVECRRLTATDVNMRSTPGCPNYNNIVTTISSAGVQLRYTLATSVSPNPPYSRTVNTLPTSTCNGVTHSWAAVEYVDGNGNKKAGYVSAKYLACCEGMRCSQQGQRVETAEDRAVSLGFVRTCAENLCGASSGTCTNARSDSPCKGISFGSCLIRAQSPYTAAGIAAHLAGSVNYAGCNGLASIQFGAEARREDWSSQAAKLASSACQANSACKAVYSWLQGTSVGATFLKLAKTAVGFILDSNSLPFTFKAPRTYTYSGTRVDYTTAVSIGKLLGMSAAGGTNSGPSTKWEYMVALKDDVEQTKIYVEAALVTALVAALAAAPAAAPELVLAARASTPFLFALSGTGGAGSQLVQPIKDVLGRVAWGLRDRSLLAASDERGIEVDVGRTTAGVLYFRIVVIKGDTGRSYQISSLDNLPTKAW